MICIPNIDVIGYMLQNCKITNNFTINRYGVTEEILFMIRRIPIVLLAVLLVSGAANAEFYKYYDENGNVHFTDDFNQVPLDQRENVEGYAESEPSEEEPLPAEAEPTDAPDENTSAQQGEEESSYDFAGKMQELDQRKDELTAEHDALMAENKQLDEIKKNVKTSDERKQYNERVRLLNEKFEEHDKKRKAFYQEVQEYNKRVGLANQKKE